MLHYFHRSSNLQQQNESSQISNWILLINDTIYGEDFFKFKQAGGYLVNDDFVQIQLVITASVLGIFLMGDVRKLHLTVNFIFRAALPSKLGCA